MTLMTASSETGAWAGSFSSARSWRGFVAPWGYGAGVLFRLMILMTNTHSQFEQVISPNRHSCSAPQQGHNILTRRFWSGSESAEALNL